MHILAFDVGASGGKAFLASLRRDRLELAEQHRFANRRYALHGHLYWDALDIFHNLNLSIEKALQGHRIASLGIDAFCNDFAFVGPAGDLLTPVRCYRDPRTARHRDAIFSRISPEALYAATGNQISLFSTFMQLFAMKLDGQQPWNGQNQLLFLPDLLAYFLTGERICEYTLASVSQLYDYRGGGWSPQLLDLLELPPETFAPIVQPGSFVGAVGKEYCHGREPFPLVTVPAHDTACAFLASVPGRGKTAILSAGTWSVLGVTAPAPLLRPEGLLANIANEGGPKGYHRISLNVMGSWIIQQLREELQQAGTLLSYGDISQIAAHAPRGDATLFDVNHPTLFHPGSIVQKIRSLCGAGSQSPPPDTASLIASIYHSMSAAYKQAISHLEQYTGERLASINIVGGGAQDATLCQMTADATGLPVYAGPYEATAIGNALVQLLAQGELSSVAQGHELIRRSFPLRIFEPCPQV